MSDEARRWRTSWTRLPGQRRSGPTPSPRRDARDEAHTNCTPSPRQKITGRRPRTTAALSLFAAAAARASSRRRAASALRRRSTFAGSGGGPCPQTRQVSPGPRAPHTAQTSSSLFFVAPPLALASAERRRSKASKPPLVARPGRCRRGRGAGSSSSLSSFLGAAPRALASARRRAASSSSSFMCSTECARKAKWEENLLPQAEQRKRFDGLALGGARVGFARGDAAGESASFASSLPPPSRSAS